MEEINRKTAAPQEDMQKVITWLESQGVDHINARANDVQFSTTVSQAQQLFKAKLNKFCIPNDYDDIFMVRRAGELQVPEELKGIIDFIVGI